MTTINVTQEDIDSATSLLLAPGLSRCANCPVTRALNRATGDKWWTSPCLATRMAPSGLCLLAGPGNHAELPEDVTKRINLYDWEGIMEPFSFELDLT